VRKGAEAKKPDIVPPCGIAASSIVLIRIDMGEESGYSLIARTCARSLNTSK
jgi:hypothetical protein